MKKHVRLAAATLLAALICTLAGPMAVRADVIYEPWDSFYEEHRGECIYNSRNYLAVGPNGDVTVYESPESDRVETKLDNGETLWISYIYEDESGIRWGCWESWEMDLIGWVPMDYLEVIYDGISFDEEYGEQFVNEDGALDDQYRGQTIYFWDYPGCPNAGWYELPSDADWLPEYSVLYTDPQNRTWGKLSYYMGYRDSWICLDDPTADYETLFPNGPEETEPPTEPTQPAETVTEIVPQKPKGALPWASAAVIAVVAVTAVLLVLLKKKK